ncbi:MAG TPA: hypothetical protein VK753_00975, partial [Xanthomonadaceae bacterium]|nr:hypothetical protein [Xanthomonadaceae bacterium]
MSAAPLSAITSPQAIFPSFTAIPLRNGFDYLHMRSAGTQSRFIRKFPYPSQECKTPATLSKRQNL